MRSREPLPAASAKPLRHGGTAGAAIALVAELVLTDALESLGSPAVEVTSRTWRARAVLLLLLAACSAEKAGESTGGSPGAGGAGAAGGVEVTGGSAGAAAGGAGGSAGAAAGSAGASGAAGSAGAGGCAGAFSEPTVVFSVPGMEIGGLSLGPGELELVYGAGPTAMPSARGFFRSVRADKQSPFGPGEPLPELDAACGDSTLLRSGDLSADGLRFYFTCYTDFSAPPAALRVARRASPSEPFVVDSAEYGSVLSGPSISSDELTLLTSPASLDGVAPLAHSRGAPAEAFGSGSALTGLEGLFTPEISLDDRFLFASANRGAALVVAERAGAGAPFSTPSVLIEKPATSAAVGSPAISDDCRSLYYIDVATDPVGGGPIYTVMVMRR